MPVHAHPSADPPGPGPGPGPGRIRSGRLPLIPVPGRGSDSCPSCHGPPDLPGVCRSCRRLRLALGPVGPAVVAPVSLAPAGGGLASALASYKSDQVPPGVRGRLLVELGVTLWTWLARHEACVLSALDRPRFDLLTTIPSTVGRPGPHPLEILTSRVVTGSRDRVRSVLAPGRTDLGRREPHPQRFTVQADVTGATVLLLDDTWVTGARSSSAAAALHQAGAAAVAVVVLGRWINPAFGANDAWWPHHRHDPWRWGRCCLDPPPAVSAP